MHFKRLCLHLASNLKNINSGSFFYDIQVINVIFVQPYVEKDNTVKFYVPFSVTVAVPVTVPVTIDVAVTIAIAVTIAVTIKILLLLLLL